MAHPSLSAAAEDYASGVSLYWWCEALRLSLLWD